MALLRKSDLHAERQRVAAQIAKAEATHSAAQNEHDAALEAWREAVRSGESTNRLSVGKSRAQRRVVDAAEALAELRELAQALDQRIAEEQARADYATAAKAYADASSAREAAASAVPREIEQAIDQALAAFDTLRDRVAEFNDAIRAEQQAHSELASLADQAGELAPGPLIADPIEAVMVGLVDRPAKQLLQAARHQQRRVVLQAASDVLIARQHGPHEPVAARNLAQPPVQPPRPRVDNPTNQYLLEGDGPGGLLRPPLLVDRG